MAPSERARLLKNLKVKFGDVEAGDEVGRLAIASVKDGSEEMQYVMKVRQVRLYE